MNRFRLIAVLLLAGGLACAGGKPAAASIYIHVDKPTQVMTVTVDGRVRISLARLDRSHQIFHPSPALTRPSASRRCITRASGTMPACRIRSFSPRAAMPSMAQTIPASARPRRMVVSRLSLGNAATLVPARLGARPKRYQGRGPRTGSSRLPCRQPDSATAQAGQARLAEAVLLPVLASFSAQDGSPSSAATSMLRSWGGPAPLLPTLLNPAHSAERAAPPVSTQLPARTAAPTFESGTSNRANDLLGDPVRQYLPARRRDGHLYRLRAHHRRRSPTGRR